MRRKDTKHKPPVKSQRIDQGTSTKKSARKLPVKRKSAWERLCVEREKALHEHLVIQRVGNEKTHDALTSLLVELSNQTGITWWDPKILKVFYRRACQVAEHTEGSERHRIFDVIGNIGKVLDLKLPDDTLDHVARHAQFPRMNAQETVANLISRDPSKVGYRATPLDDDEPAPEPAANTELETLRGKLERLELLPENEAISFQLKTQIYRLEREGETVAELWPDVVEA